MDTKFDWTVVVELIQQKGDEKAVRFLYEKTRDSIYHQIRSEYGFSEQESEALLQDVYATAYQNIGRLNDPNEVVNWLSQICRDKCNAKRSAVTPYIGAAEVYSAAGAKAAAGTKAAAGAKAAARTKAASGTGSPAAAGTSSAIGTVGTAAGKTAKGGFLATTTGKIAVILIAAILIAGGVAAGIILGRNNAKKSPEQVITSNAPEQETVTEKSPEEIRREINAAFLQFVYAYKDLHTENMQPGFSMMSVPYYSLEYGDDGIPPMIFYKWVEQSMMGDTGICLGIYDQGEIIAIDDVGAFCQYFEGADPSIAFLTGNTASTEDMHTEFIKLKDDPSLYVFWRKAFGTNYLDQYQFSDGKFHLVKRISGATTGFGGSNQEMNDQEEIDRLLGQNEAKQYLSLTQIPGTENSGRYWTNNGMIILNLMDDPYMYISPEQIELVLGA